MELLTAHKAGMNSDKTVQVLIYINLLFLFVFSLFVFSLFVFYIYRKNPKISPGAYIFQRPFLRGLFMEGLIFGGAYLWREICVSKSIGLALCLEGNLPFLLSFTLYLRENFQLQVPGEGGGGGLYLEGRFNGWFLRYEFGGLIHGGAYFRNFTV